MNFLIFTQVYVELAHQSEKTNDSRHVDFKIHTKAAGFPYRYAMIINQINCDLLNSNKGKLIIYASLK
jgi:hypothetical protein